MIRDRIQIGKSIFRLIILSAGFLTLAQTVTIVSGGWDFGLTAHAAESMELIRELEQALSSDNFFRQAVVLDRIRKLSQEELLVLKQKTVDSSETQQEITRLIAAHESDQGYLREDILFDCLPAARNAPFYAGTPSSRNITQLSAEAERIYKDNLSLPRRAPLLVQKSEQWWIEATPHGKDTAQNNFLKKISATPLVEPEGKKMKKKWVYRYRRSRAHDFFFAWNDGRQWVKKYEEPLIFSVSFRDYIIVRNESRIFGIDRRSGKELWRWGLPAADGGEYYHTRRHPHTNSYGCPLTLQENILFAEIDNALVACELSSEGPPTPRWILPLGEYTLCTKPVVAGDQVVAGLINAREEIFVCSLSVQTGAITWSRFVGISSFLSPVSTLAAFDQQRIFLGTNAGALLCLARADGTLLWAKKYSPKSYNVFDYCYSPVAGAPAIAHRSIAFDTQFLELGDDGLMYYKARESDYCSILNATTGAEVDKVYVPADRWRLLRARDGRALMLKNGDTQKEQHQACLMVFDIKTHAVIERWAIPEDELRGVIFLSDQQTLIKIGAAVHFVNITQKKARHSLLESDSRGWVVTVENDLLVCAEGQLIEGLSMFTDASSRQGAALISEHAAQALFALTKAVNSSAQSDESDPAISVLCERAKRYVSTHDIWQWIRKHEKKLVVHKRLGEELCAAFGEEMVMFGGVHLRLRNYFKARCIWGGEAIQRQKVFSEPDTARKDALGASRAKIKVNGEMMTIVPVRVFGKTGLLPFFLLRRFDQIVCVDESGEIKWVRNVFIPGAEGAKTAFLWGETLVINDVINIVAVNLKSGALEWCMSGSFDDIRRRGNPSLRVVPLADRLLVIRGETVYSIDPVLGVRMARKRMPMYSASFLDCSDDEKNMYLTDPSMGRVLHIDREGVIRRNFIAAIKGQKILQTFAVSDGLLLQTASGLLSVSANDGEIIDSVEWPEKKDVSCERFEDIFVIISPDSPLIAYRLAKGQFVKIWELAVPSRLLSLILKATDDPLSKWLLNKNVYTAGSPYARCENYLFFPVQKSGKLALVAVDVSQGTIASTTLFADVPGIFVGLSSLAIRKRQARVMFIVTAAEIKPGELFGSEDVDKLGMREIKIYYCRFDVASGNPREQMKKDETFQYLVFPDPNLINTTNADITLVNGQFLYLDPVL